LIQANKCPLRPPALICSAGGWRISPEKRLRRVWRPAFGCSNSQRTSLSRQPRGFDVPCVANGTSHRLDTSTGRRGVRSRSLDRDSGERLSQARVSRSSCCSTLCPRAEEVQRGAGEGARSCLSVRHLR
jgi:hypothetical protein